MPPGKTDRVQVKAGTLTYAFPITGLVGGAFAGNIPNVVKLGSLTKRIVVSDFTIDLNGVPPSGRPRAPSSWARCRTAPGGVPDGARVALFDVDLSKPAIDAKHVQVAGASLKLTAVAAGALNAELGTSVLGPGLNVFSSRANA